MIENIVNEKCAFDRNQFKTPVTKVKESKFDNLYRIKKFGPFNEILTSLRKIVPGKEIVIAGGAIRDILSLNEDAIKDVDVFILDTEEHEAAKYHSKFSDEFGGFSLAGKQYNDNPDLSLVWNTEFPFKKAAALIQLFSRSRQKVLPVQIIAHKAKTVEELLEDFDWRACQFAYDSKHIWTPGILDFYENTLSLKKVKSALNTLRRGFYLENKYRTSLTTSTLKFRREDILNLAAMLLMDPEA